MKRYLIAVICVIVISALGPALDWAKADDLSELVEQAQHEGTVIYYGVTNPEAMTPILKMFKEKYPFLEVKHFRTAPPALLEKVLAESRVGRYPDVVGNNFFENSYLASRDFFEPYEPAEKKFVRPEFVDPKNRFIGIGFNPFALAYNTNFLRPGDLPRTYEDFLDPKWKGKLGFNPSNVGWVIALVDFMGKERGEKFFQDLSRQEIGLTRGNSLHIQHVAAGEYRIGIATYAYLISLAKRKGAPVDFAYLKPIFSDWSVDGLVKRAEHKAAGKLLIRFLLSQQAQKLYRDTGRMPTRIDVKPLDPRLTEDVKFNPFKPEWADRYRAYAEFVQRIFAKRR